MDAVNFLKEKNQMCEQLDDCFDCPIGNYCGRCQAGACINQHMSEEELVNIVEQWSAEHPKKTRQSEFLKIFPNVRTINNVIEIKPCDIDIEVECINRNNTCDYCRIKYWLTEVEDDKN